uniref:Uncharacterized protein n=1 Tax=Arundo donax TaxID=35708 RepID=A0A0A8YKN0_ARUDO
MPGGYGVTVSLSPSNRIAKQLMLSSYY